MSDKKITPIDNMLMHQAQHITDLGRTMVRQGAALILPKKSQSI